MATGFRLPDLDWRIQERQQNDEKASTDKDPAGYEM